mmetsp:Transcript_29279/g.113536  ORF Transcript_29279/g.113536 Transcript_29279/m.113536 type:complete len:91 (+) Transcript_29279:122-394(+)
MIYINIRSATSKEGFTRRNDVLYSYTVPTVMVQGRLRSYHEGPTGGLFGNTKTRNLIKRKNPWTTMTEDIATKLREKFHSSLSRKLHDYI